MGFSHQLDVEVEEHDSVAGALGPRAGERVDGWSGYHVDSSMITAADGFELRRPFDARSWNLLRRGASITIRIDGTAIMRGFIDRRVKNSKAGTMTISGRDRVGRLVDESAPRINYSAMKILPALQELVSPWFDKVTLSDVRNRTLRVGKGKRLARSQAPAEPTIQIAIRVPRRGVVHPGQTRWQIMHEIASRGSALVYSSADGTEIFFGKPNYAQQPLYLFRRAAPHSPNSSTVDDMTITEDDGDRYSLIVCGGVGGQSDTNYGKNVIDNRGVAFDNPANRRDGVGRDFLYPKRMYMPERDFESYGDASQVAHNEMARRDYKRHLISVEAPLHGQRYGSDEYTLFAPTTIAHVIDEEQQPILDGEYLIVSCAYSGQHDQGETTTMHLVPSGTEILL